jgi:hypothetical protein
VFKVLAFTVGFVFSGQAIICGWYFIAEFHWPCEERSEQLGYKPVPDCPQFVQYLAYQALGKTCQQNANIKSGDIGTLT